MPNAPEIPKYFNTENIVCLGDTVEIRRRWRRALRGRVIQVFDPGKPWGPKSSNEHGFTVECEVNNYRDFKNRKKVSKRIFHFEGTLISLVKFIERESLGNLKKGTRSRKQALLNRLYR